MNNIHQIIRLEHPIDGIGIFISRYTFNLYETEIGNIIKERHEEMKIAHDIKGFTTKHYCAYKNIEDLNKWILPSELKHLIERGIKVLLLDVFNVIEDENQVLYLKEDIFSSKNITSLFE
jgi:hypothetical protein